MPLARLVFLLAFAWLAACGGKISTSAAPTDAATEQPSAVCTWPTSFDSIDASPARDSCRAGRMFVACKSSFGGDSWCIKNELKECDVPTPSGATYMCSNECKPTEFAAGCGTIGGSSVTPPADCRVTLATPSGIVFYCCPCSS